MATIKDEFRIKFFNSPEKLNEAVAKRMAERTPEESLQIANLIITAMYRDELELSAKRFDRITFVEPTAFYHK